MILKSGFLLIELMVSIALFTFFLAAICSLQVISLKNRDFATKRTSALTLLISEIDGTKKKGADFVGNQQVAIENLPEVVLVKNDKNLGSKRKTRALQLKKFTVQKETLGKRLCTVCLVSI